MHAAFDAVVEIFSWVGFGAGALLAGIALVIYLFDGTWLPVRAVVERPSTAGSCAGSTRTAASTRRRSLTSRQHALGGEDMADIFYRRGCARPDAAHPAFPVRAVVALLAAGLIGLGVVALIASWVLLFARG